MSEKFIRAEIMEISAPYDKGYSQKIEDCRKFDELSKKHRGELMSTAELLDEVLLEPYTSDANMRPTALCGVALNFHMSTGFMRRYFHLTSQPCI